VSYCSDGHGRTDIVGRECGAAAPDVEMVDCGGSGERAEMLEVDVGVAGYVEHLQVRGGAADDFEDGGG
jgi:hypothetical protein